MFIYIQEFVTEEFKNVNSRLEELKLQVVGSPEELEEVRKEASS